MNNTNTTTLLQSPLVKKRRKSIILQAMDAQQNELLGKSISEVLHSFLTATMAIIACQSCFVAMLEENEQAGKHLVSFRCWLLRSQSQEIIEEIEIKNDKVRVEIQLPTHHTNSVNHIKSPDSPKSNTHQRQANKVLFENLMSNTSLFHCNSDPDWLHAVFNGNPIHNWSLLRLNAQNHHIGGAVFINRSSQHCGYLNKNEWDIISGCLGSLLYHHSCKLNSLRAISPTAQTTTVPHTQPHLYHSPVEPTQNLLRSKSVSPQSPQFRRLQGTSSTRTGSPHGEAKMALVERKLADALQSAQKAIEERNLLLKNMSHELKTPLNCIVGMQNMLLYTPLNSEQRDYVNLIGRSANVLLTLINDVLDYSQTDRWKSYDIVEFDLRRCVEEVFEICTLKGQAKNIEMVTMYDSRIPYNMVILGDVVRVSHILFNLICNAIKFTNEGTVMLKTMLDHFEILENAQYIFIKFEIHDTGVGIEEINFSKLGTPFLQLNPNNSEGTGLGLAICKSLIAEMKGSLNLASTVGKGSVFSVVLPFQIAINPSASLTIENSWDKYKNELAKKTIYIVDSQLASRTSLKQILEQFGARVIESDSLAFLSKEEQKNLHTVFVDDSVIPSIDKLNEFVDSFAPPARIVITATHVAIGKYSTASTLPRVTKPYKLKMVMQKIVAEHGPDEQRQPLLKSHDLPVDEVKGTSNQNILIVDDNVVNLKVLSHMLTKLKLHHDVAHHGQEAVDLASKHTYGLIFMDLMMPIKDGYEASKEIRQLPAPNGSATIVALTAKTMTAQDLQHCKEVGMNTVLCKPINFAQLSSFLQPFVSSGAINATITDQSSVNRRFSSPL